MQRLSNENLSSTHHRLLSQASGRVALEWQVACGVVQFVAAHVELLREIHTFFCDLELAHQRKKLCLILHLLQAFSEAFCFAAFWKHFNDNNRERKYYQNDFQPVTWYLLLLSCTDRSKLSEIGHKWRYGLYIPLGIDPQKNTTLPHQYQVNLSKHYIRDLTYRLVMTHKKTWPFRLLALKSVNTKRNWGNDISRNSNPAWYWPTWRQGISPSCT